MQSSIGLSRDLSPNEVGGDLLLMLIDNLDAHGVNHVFSHDLSCLEGYPRIVRTRDDLSHKPRAKQLKEIAKQIASYASKKVRKHFS